MWSITKSPPLGVDARWYLLPPLSFNCFQYFAWTFLFDPDNQTSNRKASWRKTIANFNFRRFNDSGNKEKYVMSMLEFAPTQASWHSLSIIMYAISPACLGKHTRRVRSAPARLVWKARLFRLQQARAPLFCVIWSKLRVWAWYLAGDIFFPPPNYPIVEFSHALARVCVKSPIFPATTGGSPTMPQELIEFTGLGP